MHLYSLCQTWLNLKTHTVPETENRTSRLTTISQTITISSCQSDISNQCRIKTPCITGMAEKSNPPIAGWRRLLGCVTKPLLSDPRGGG